MRIARIQIGKTAVSLVLVGALASLGGHLRSPPAAEELAGSGDLKDNLDLPYEAEGPGPEEDVPTEIVFFYGRPFEGDGFFYVIDRSRTMQDRGELARAKRELIRNISELSSGAEFGIVFFDARIFQFPANGCPLKASPAAKSDAVAFVESVPGGASTCCQQALVAALRMAARSTARRKVILYLGDGGGTCQGAEEGAYLEQTLKVVTALNYERVEINAIGVLDVGPLQESFLQRLTENNGGTYTYVGQ